MRNNSANKFFDGLAAGKPLMINYGGWQSKIIENYSAGFIIPNNEPKLAFKIINDIVFDEKKITSMSNMSRKLSVKYSLESCSDKFDKVINQIAY